MNAEWWLPIRVLLSEDLHVITMAEALGCSPHEVVGTLVRIWGWFCSSSDDGRITLGGRPFSWWTQVVEERLAVRKGFLVQMKAAGWLAAKGDQVSIPEFEDWLSGAARRRTLNTQRQRRKRVRDGETVTPKRDQRKGKETRQEQTRIYNDDDDGRRDGTGDLIFSDVSAMKAVGSRFNGLINLNHPPDRSLVEKIAILRCLDLISEGMLADLIGSLQSKPRKPGAYLMAALKAALAAQGRDARRLLARVKVPQYAAGGQANGTLPTEGPLGAISAAVAEVSRSTQPL